MKMEELLNQNYHKFSENDKYICRCIMERKKECGRMTLEEFAGVCHVSESMLVRFAKKIGMSGYGEMKARLRLEREQTEEIPKGLLEMVTGSYHKMMDELKQKDLSSLFEKVYRAERIFVYGSGSAQTRAASEMKRIFLPVRTMFHIHGHDMRKALSNIISARDMAVIISLSGESEATVKLAEELRLRQIPALSITRMQNNTLASLCDENLYIHSVRLPAQYGIEYEISTPYFILLEYLYLSYRDYLCRIEF